MCLSIPFNPAIYLAGDGGPEHLAGGGHHRQREDSLLDGGPPDGEDEEPYNSFSPSVKQFSAPRQVCHGRGQMLKSTLGEGRMIIRAKNCTFVYLPLPSVDQCSVPLVRSPGRGEGGEGGVLSVAGCRTP